MEHLHVRMHTYTCTYTGSGQAGFEQLSTGINRPIPGKDMRNIESQLQHHLHEERKRREHRGDLLRADPYKTSMLGGGSRGGIMTDSTASTSNMFYSLDLRDSFSEPSRSGERSMETSTCTAVSSAMGDSYTSTVHSHTLSGDGIHSRYDPFGDGASVLDSVSLHEGPGLQQLAHSPLTGRRRGAERDSIDGRRRGRGGVGGGRAGITQQDVCKYSLTLSGVTVAILEADPAYTHPHSQRNEKPRGQGKTEQIFAAGLSGLSSSSSSSSRYSSLDSSGLDPMSYLSEVAKVLRGGVNRREIQRNQERLGQALPQDHLL